MRKIIYNKLDDVNVEPFENEIVFIKSEDCRYIFKNRKWQNYDDIIKLYEIKEDEIISEQVVDALLANEKQDIEIIEIKLIDYNELVKNNLIDNNTFYIIIDN